MAREPGQAGATQRNLHTFESIAHSRCGEVSCPGRHPEPSAHEDEKISRLRLEMSIAD